LRGHLEPDREKFLKNSGSISDRLQNNFFPGLTRGTLGKIPQSGQLPDATNSNSRGSKIIASGGFARVYSFALLALGIGAVTRSITRDVSDEEPIIASSGRGTSASPALADSSIARERSFAIAQAKEK
jgi:hypothetical protein